jgi:NTE family protein
MTIAFVLSGGGSLGAVQVGMLQALSARGIQPDLLVGASAGAVNAAWVADHGMSAESLADLAEMWQGLRRRDIFPVRPTRVVQAVVGQQNSLCTSDHLGELVRAHADINDLRDATTPVHLVATNLLSGVEVLISSGDVVEAVRASSAIPGVFPPVLVDGRWLVDGAMAARTGVVQALELGADTVYVLPAGVPCALPRPPRSAVGVALHALALLVEQRLVAEVEDQGRAHTVRLLPPLCPLAVSAADFSQAAQLIQRGREASTRWLATGGTERAHPERFLKLHHHAPARL